jgi:cobalt-zinc-cadmium resistance protein CzcA
MLEKIISWSLAHRYTVLAGTLLLVIAGLWSVTKLKVDAFPDTTPVQVQVNTAAPSLVPEEVERQVTFPVEMAMGGMPGLESLRSVSLFGLSQVTLTFKDGTNVYFARQLVNERLGTVELPPGVPKPEMGPVSTGLGEVFQYAIFGKPETLTDRRTYQDWTLKAAIRPTPGVAEVNTWGGLRKQFQVRVDPQRLLKYDLTLDDVTRALPANNLNVGGGSVGDTGSSVLVHGVGRVTNVSKIENIVLKSFDGVPVKIMDVGQVAIGHEIRRGAICADGKGEVVLGLGFMLMGENSHAVTTRVREQFEKAQKNAPAGFELVPLYDRTKLVDRVIDTVRKNLFEGAFLVVVILYLLLGNLRAGLLAAVTIPLSLLFGFCMMVQVGIAGSLLSLGAIDFGIVVDSGVVVIENIMKKLGHHQGVKGAARLELIRKAAIEVKNPTVFGQLIILIVYVPILTLEGVEGKLFRPMALTVMFILLGSLILSLTLTPVLSSFFLPKNVEEKEVWLLRFIKPYYAAGLRGFLQFRYAVIFFTVIALTITIGVASRMGGEFVPKLSEGDLVIGVLRSPGTSLEESVRLNTIMEKRLLEKFPNEVEHVWSRIGAPEVPTEAGSIEMTDMFISLKPRAGWKKATSQAELAPDVLACVEDIPGQVIWMTQPIEQRLNEMVSGVRADVAIKLFGKDLELLSGKAQEIGRVLRKIDGGADVTVEQALGQPVLRVRLKPDAIARYGISAGHVMEVVESLGGKSVGEVLDGTLRFPLVVRLPESFRNDIESFKRIPLSAPGGQKTPLERVATIEQVVGAKMVTREWGKRRIVVQCNVRGRDVASFVAEAQKLVGAQVTLPQDQFEVEWGGQFENMQRAQAWLMIAVPLALALILALLYVTFRGWRETVFVFLSVPVACVGGVLGLYFREMPFSISAAVGFITLSGVSVLNGMVWVSLLRQKLSERIGLIKAIEGTGVESLRTVIMTSLVASAGFVPMAVSTGDGAEVQRPLATVVIGGIFTAVVMSLVVLPAIFAAFYPQRRRSDAESAIADDEIASNPRPHDEHEPVLIG